MSLRMPKMSPLWLLVFLTWYHLSTGSETEDFKTNDKTKNTIILQPSDASQRQIGYEVIAFDNLSTEPPKFEHFPAPNDNEDDDVMVYSISISNGSPLMDYSFPQATSENHRVKRSAITNKSKRSAESILNFEDSNKQNKNLLRSNIYNLLLQAENLDSMGRGQFSSLVPSPKIKIDGADDKRNAKFHSWGGKRNIANYARAPSSPYIDTYIDPGVFYENMKNVYDTNDRKRARFSSWGGKRAEEEKTGPKTLPFRPWGGKRDKPDILVWPKYTPFKAWGGKRSGSVGFYPPDDQSLNTPLKKNNRNRRQRFHSWGGKRSDFFATPLSTTLQREGNSDNPLNIGEDNDGSDMGLLPYSGNDGMDKRLKFNAWGGKRSPDSADYPVNKKSFHSWGGKRATSTSKEPDVTDDDEISLVSFEI